MDTQIGRSRLHEQIEESIRTAITTGEFPVGSKLPSERNLMEMFDVGRPSVKEALLMLERKGFVKLRRGAAAEVIAPTPEGAMDAIGDMVAAMIADPQRRGEFYDLRIVLETHAAMEAARSGSDDEIAALAEALEECRAVAGRAEPFRDADIAFHRSLIAIPGNSVAAALHDALIEWGLFHPEEGPALAGIHARVIAQHRAILDAIEARDPAAAAEALRGHLLTRRDAAET